MSQADYQRWAEVGLLMVNTTKQQWPSLAPDRHRVASYGIGINARSMAVGLLMLGRLAEARAAFRECAEGFVRGANPEGDNVSAQMWGLEAAMLTGDQAFWRQTAEAMPDMTARKKPAEHPYAMFLKYAMLGKDASPWADELLAVNPATLSKRGGYGTLGPLCKAVARRDLEEARTAFEALLAEHKVKARGWAKQPQGAVCLPGAALLLLARDLGMPLEVDSPYIPQSLLG